MGGTVPSSLWGRMGVGGWAIGLKFEGKPKQERSPVGGSSWSCPFCCSVLEEWLAFGGAGQQPRERLWEPRSWQLHGVCAPSAGQPCSPRLCLSVTCPAPTPAPHSLDGNLMSHPPAPADRAATPRAGGPPTVLLLRAAGPAACQAVDGR